METINISNLKAQISSVLRRVKSGRSFIIVDRSYPVAKLTTLTEEVGLSVIQEAETDFKPPQPSCRQGLSDPVAILVADRLRR